MNFKEIVRLYLKEATVSRSGVERKWGKDAEGKKEYTVREKQIGQGARFPTKRKAEKALKQGKSLLAKHNIKLGKIKHTPEEEEDERRRQEEDERDYEPRSLLRRFLKKHRG